MRTLAAMLMAAGLPAVSLAYPDGPPWGHAGVDGGEDCTACHFQHDAVAQSQSIVIEGLPGRYEAGQTYPLTVRVVDSGETNGFELAATAGRFERIDPAAAVNGGAAHSVETGASWQVVWIAPQEIGGPVRFWLAVNIANGDESEFGDRIHLKNWEIAG
ncbi:MULTISPECIES: choice-of-anchor V domain-containing protein [Hyphobacterium]|uniref:Choice-of-anchor V domain-containing protein n=1 Tax=Hyphobacterium vulgare TaxID=1736751 RepID=A0ABV7A0C2_9PROT